MNKSVLGADLEAEREKAFMARFGRILSQKEKLSQGDADYIRSLTRRLAATGGGFSPSIAQSTWLTDIDARLSALVAPRAPISGPDLEKLIEAARGLCCTNRVRDSSRESNVVAAGHEQTHAPRLQDPELA